MNTARSDEQQVRDACMRYWAGFDRRDIDLYLSAFTEDATLSLFGGATTVEISDATAARLLDAPFEHSCHVPASQVVRVDGDTASADTLVVAHLVPEIGPIAVRGVRYLDDLVRTERGWRIRHRQHSVLWQHDATLVEPHVPTTR